MDYVSFLGIWHSPLCLVTGTVWTSDWPGWLLRPAEPNFNSARLAGRCEVTGICHLLPCLENSSYFPPFHQPKRTWITPQRSNERKGDMAPFSYSRCSTLAVMEILAWMWRHCGVVHLRFFLLPLLDTTSKTKTTEGISKRKEMTDIENRELVLVLWTSPMDDSHKPPTNPVSTPGLYLAHAMSCLCIRELMTFSAGPIDRLASWLAYALHGKRLGSWIIRA